MNTKRNYLMNSIASIWNRMIAQERYKRSYSSKKIHCNDSKATVNDKMPWKKWKKKALAKLVFTQMSNDRDNLLACLSAPTNVLPNRISTNENMMIIDATRNTSVLEFNFYVNIFEAGNNSDFSIRIDFKRSLTPKPFARRNAYLNTSVVDCIWTWCNDHGTKDRRK